MISMILQLVQQSNVSESLFSELMLYCAYSVRPQMYFLSDYTNDAAKKIVMSHSNVLHDGERSPQTGAPAESTLSRRCVCRQARNVSLYR